MMKCSFICISWMLRDDDIYRFNSPFSSWFQKIMIYFASYFVWVHTAYKQNANVPTKPKEKKIFEFWLISLKYVVRNQWMIEKELWKKEK